MGMQPPSRGMKTVPDLLMINFLYWLSAKHKNTYVRLQFLPIQTLMQLVYEFEHVRPDMPQRSQVEWQQSVQLLFVAGGPQDDYNDARKTYKKLL